VCKGIDEELLLIQVHDLSTGSSLSPMGLPLMTHLLDVKETELVGALGLGQCITVASKNFA